MSSYILLTFGVIIHFFLQCFRYGTSVFQLTNLVEAVTTHFNTELELQEVGWCIRKMNGFIQGDPIKMEWHTAHNMWMQEMVCLARLLHSGEPSH